MKTVNCPRCQKVVPWNEQSPFRPFCSERCKIIDLGAWADGSYSIPSADIVSPESTEEPTPPSVEDED